MLLFVSLSFYIERCQNNVIKTKINLDSESLIISDLFEDLWNIG